MKFVYTAKTKKGQARTGELEASDRASALRDLRARNLVVVSLNKAQSGANAIYLFPVSVLDRVILTKHLSIMLKAGVSLDEALRIAELQAKGKLRPVLASVRASVEAGERLADSLAKHPKVFSEYYVNMVRAGEESGNLSGNLEQLSKRFSKDFDLRQKALSAMFYPLLVLAMTGGLGALIAFYVLPRLIPLFNSFNFALPLPTKILLLISQVVTAYGVWIAVGLGTFVVLSVVIGRTKPAKPIVDWLLLHLPVLRQINLPLNLSRFSMVLGSLLQCGMPIDAALGVTKQVIGNYYFQRIIEQAKKHVADGEPFSSSLIGSEDLIPPFVYRMIEIGDETGKTEDILFYLADFYEAELDATLKNLSTLIEPALLIAIGASVLFVALSIITPIYNFVGSIG